MAVRFKQLSKTSTEWASLNPTLLEGEIGFESDTNKLKVGNGVDAWNNLEYVAGNGSNVDASNLVDLTSAQTITGVKTISTQLDFADDVIIKGYGTGNRPSVNIGYNTDNAWGNVTLGYSNTQYATGSGIVIGSNNRNIINSANNTILIGTSIRATSQRLIRIGNNFHNGSESLTVVSGESAIGIGTYAITQADEAIQLGTGTNSNTKTFQVFDYQMLDGNTGKIPTERLNLGTKKYLHRITLNLSDQASGSPPNKTAVIHLDYYSEQETAYTSPNFATIALTSSIGCSGYYIDSDTSITEKNFVYEIALPQSNEFVLNSSFSITIQSTGSSITDEVVGYIFS